MLLKFAQSARSTATPAAGATPRPETSSGAWRPWPGGLPISQIKPLVPPSDTPTSTSSTLGRGQWRQHLIQYRRSCRHSIYAAEMYDAFTGDPTRTMRVKQYFDRDRWIYSNSYWAFDQYCIDRFHLSIATFVIFIRSNRVKMISPSVRDSKDTKLCFSFWWFFTFLVGLNFFFTCSGTFEIFWFKVRCLWRRGHHKPAYLPRGLEWCERGGAGGERPQLQRQHWRRWEQRQANGLTRLSVYLRVHLHCDVRLHILCNMKEPRDGTCPVHSSFLSFPQEDCTISFSICSGLFCRGSFCM